VLCSYDLTVRCCAQRANDKWLGTEEESFADRVSMIELKSLGDWKKTLFDGEVHYDVLILSISHVSVLDRACLSCTLLLTPFLH